MPAGKCAPFAAYCSTRRTVAAAIAAAAVGAPTWSSTTRSSERSQLRVVDDQVGAPTAAAAIAAATVRLVEQYAATGSHFAAGLYHMTAAGSTSWCGFARAIFSSGILAAPPQVQAIASSEYPTPAKRPANSVLSNDKFAHAFGFQLPPWQQQLQQVVAAMQVAR